MLRKVEPKRDPTVRTKYLNRAKVGEVVGLPFGMILPVAIRLKRIGTDEEGRRFGAGHVVARQGFSTAGVNWYGDRELEFYL